MIVVGRNGSAAAQRNGTQKLSSSAHSDTRPRLNRCSAIGAAKNVLGATSLAVMHSAGDAMLPCSFPGGVLRRLRPSDVFTFQAYRAIPDLGHYQGWSPISDSDALAFLTEMNAAPLFTPGEWVQLGIAEPTAERLVGDLGLFLAADESLAEVGFTLEPRSQGRGIATAAVQAAVQLLFTTTQVQQVRGITDTRNVASIRLLERAGFHYKETPHVVFRGESCSEDVYVLPRSVGLKKLSERCVVR